MREIKLDNGVKIKLKDLSIDERDTLMDGLKFTKNEKGEFDGMEMPYSTMTKFIRVGVDGDTSDKFLKTLTVKDRADIFAAIQKDMLEGEDKPSK